MNFLISYIFLVFNCSLNGIPKSLKFVNRVLVREIYFLFSNYL